MTIINILKNKNNLTIFIVVTLFFLLTYYFLLVNNVPWGVYVSTNPSLLVLLQITFSIINSALFSFSILLIYLTVKQKRRKDLTFIQTIGASLFSLATTGCYICGSILLPSIGFTSSIVILPFAGLEIKIVTAIFMAYTLRQLLRSYIGICTIKKFKRYKLEVHNHTLIFNFQYINTLKPIAITFVFVLSIYTLPYILPKSNTEQFTNVVCPVQKLTFNNYL